MAPPPRVRPAVGEALAPGGVTPRPGRALLAAFLTALLAAPGSPASATPRYALRVGQSCILCHQSPSGGGERSAYASAYLVPERLAMARPDPPPAPKSQITDELLIGADLRTFWLGQEDADTRNNFVQMQGSVYLTLQPHPRFLAYVHEELGQDPAHTPELFALAWLLPGSVWMKAGRFVPAFGWRPADHRTFTRRSFVFFPENPPQSDTGIEVGARRGPFELQLALTNGEFASAFERNDELAFVARGAALRAVGPLNVAAGASYAQHRGLDVHRWAGGPFAGASLGRLTWLGEADWLHGARPDPAGGPALAVWTSFTTSQELSVQVVRGIDAVLTFDFHDPDVRVASGAGRRFGAGVEAMPYPFLQLRAKVNRFDLLDGPAAPPLPDDASQVEVEVHLFY